MNRQCCCNCRYACYQTKKIVLCTWTSNSVFLSFFFWRKEKRRILVLKNLTCFFHLKRNIEASKGGTFSSETRGWCKPLAAQEWNVNSRSLYPQPAGACDSLCTQSRRKPVPLSLVLRSQRFAEVRACAVCVWCTGWGGSTGTRLCRSANPSEGASYVVSSKDVAQLSATVWEGQYGSLFSLI